MIISDYKNERKSIYVFMVVLLHTSRQILTVLKLNIYKATSVLNGVDFYQKGNLTNPHHCPLWCNLPADSPITEQLCHDDVIKWKHFPRYWPFVRGIHRYPVNSPHKGQWRGALMFSLFCVWINGWVNNRKAGDLRRYRAHYDVTVMH